MTRPLALLAAFFVSAAHPAYSASPALVPGEELVYSVSWIGIGAGEIRIGAREAPPVNGSPRLAITTTTATRGPVSWILNFTATGVSMYDTRTGRLQSIEESSKQRRKETRQSVTFDYAGSVAKYANQVEPAKNADLKLPAGDPMDLIMALVQTRSWNDMKPGDKRDALVIFDDDFYELTIHAEKYETLRTRFGTVQTLVLVPKMEKTEPKGMFRRGSSVRVWITQDSRRLPVRFEVETRIGDAVANLVTHRLPTPVPATPVPTAIPTPAATPAEPAQVR